MANTSLDMSIKDKELHEAYRLKDVCLNSVLPQEYIEAAESVYKKRIEKIRQGLEDEQFYSDNPFRPDF